MLPSERKKKKEQEKFKEMYSDPYQVLGISRSAADDEVKKVYRKLSRQYHPDANINAAHPEQIEEKFKEIQQAYQQIMDEREHGYSSGTFHSYGDNNSWHNQYAGEDSIKMQAAANYINSRYFAEALNVLSSVDRRSARWYYFSAIANAGIGNNINAKTLAKQAVDLDPGNMEYRRLLQQLEFGGTWYSTMGDTYESPMAQNGYCVKLCLANLVCNCCCRFPY